MRKLRLGEDVTTSHSWLEIQNQKSQLFAPELTLLTFTKYPFVCKMGINTAALKKEHTDTCSNMGEA